MSVIDFNSHNPETPFTEEELDSLASLAQAGKLDGTGASAQVIARLAYLKERSNRFSSTREDDRLMEIVVKYMNGVEGCDTMFGYVLEVAYLQLHPFISSLLNKMQVDYQDYEDYQQITYAELASKLKDYNSEQNRIPAFMMDYIKGAFFLQRNRATGITVNTKYNATITKHILNAKADLMASGNKNPTCMDIANYVNENYGLKKPYTSRQVENAMSHLVVQAEMDENIRDDSYNPEAAYFKKEMEEIFKNLTFRGDKTVRAMFDIYLDYYLNETDDFVFPGEPELVKPERRHLSNDFLIKKMEEKLGTSVSPIMVSKIKKQLRRELARKGFAPIRNPRMRAAQTPRDISFDHADMDEFTQDAMENIS